MKQTKKRAVGIALRLLYPVVLVVVILQFFGVDIIGTAFSSDSKRTDICSAPDEELEGKVLSSYSDPEEHRVVTLVEVQSAIRELGEITTVAYTYSGVAWASEWNEFFGQQLEFTRNRIEVDYEGTIRSGFVIGDIGLDVDNDNQKIIVRLPHASVFSNEITEHEVKWDDNFINRIDPDIAANLLSNAKTEELDEAVNNGLYLKAADNAQNVIREVLAQVCDYDVIFETDESDTCEFS